MTHRFPAPQPGRASGLAQGGRALILRQLVSLLTGVVGQLTLVRLLGPTDYGLYAAVFGILFFAQTVAEFSLDIYLVRLVAPSSRHYDQILTLLLISGGLSSALLLAGLGPLGHFIHIEHFDSVGLAMFLSLPLMHLQQVPLSKLENELRFVEVGWIESVAQIAYPVFAIPAAISGIGVWSMVAGWYSQQIVLLILFWMRAGYRPKLAWDYSIIRESISYGAVLTTASGSLGLRNLINPLLVGHVLGAPAVALISLMNRLFDQLSIITTVTFRVSLTYFAKMKSDTVRLRQVMYQAMALQAVAVGGPFVAFCYLGPVVIPVVFGAEWLPVRVIFPLAAPAYLAWVTFSPQVAVLAGRSRPWALIPPQLLNSLLLLVGCLLFIPWLGLQGYSAAELLTIVSCLLILRALNRLEGPGKGLSVPMLFYVPLALSCVVSIFSNWGVLLAFAPLLLTRNRMVLVGWVRLARGRGGD